MSVNTKAPTIPQIEQFGEERSVSEAVRFAQYFLLDEIPGLVFGLMTIAYIVTSLWSLTLNSLCETELPAAGTTIQATSVHPTISGGGSCLTVGCLLPDRS